MPYGEITQEMSQVIASYVMGKDVWDLGAGDGTYAELLDAFGARNVTAVDKDQAMPGRALPRGITYDNRYFDDVAAELRAQDKRIEVAFVSWPVNWRTGIARIVACADTVVYLGSNSAQRGVACGEEDFWVHVTHRKVLALVEHPRNDLIVYGQHENTYRALLREEWEACASYGLLQQH